MGEAETCGQKSNLSKQSLGAGKNNKIAIYLKTYGSSSHLIDIQEKELRARIGEMNRRRYLGEIVAVFRDFENSENWQCLPGLKILTQAVEQKQVTLVFVPRFRDLGPVSE